MKLLVKEKCPLVLCIQETKMMVCDGYVRSSLCRDSSYDYSYRSSVGASGGLLTMWDTTEVEVWSSFSQEHMLQIHGRVRSNNEEFYLFNIYAPCDLRAKAELWEAISERLQSLRRKKVCACGDFNVVRKPEERRSVIGGGVSLDINAFNLFIEENGLIDLPLNGRSFTWYKGDGSSMSRIDRYLLSEEWCFSWPNCFQVALLRGLSDHCPLQLSIDEENWGPRPTRMLKCWREVPGYSDFVSEKWRSFQVEGWGGFVLKEKLKLMKVALKE